MSACSGCLRRLEQARYRTCGTCWHRPSGITPVAPAPVQHQCPRNLTVPETQPALPRRETVRLPGAVSVLEAAALPQLPLIECVRRTICSQCGKLWPSTPAAHQVCYRCRARAATAMRNSSRTMPSLTLHWWDQLAAMIVTPFSQGGSRTCTFCSATVLSTEQDSCCCGQERNCLPCLPPSNDPLDPCCSSMKVGSPA
ncbi:hypothetical protein ETB97_008419 [Aspergillus alliaceus]|uniref:Uncharacterized protein n=1 Tax=Petromyces alliaceus TaxID=209559 RepID=A0A8H5ZWX1_PETAA|nr:hypothetical protein ETB97_008419 [Aspergillus burnettii]